MKELNITSGNIPPDAERLSLLSTFASAMTVLFAIQMGTSFRTSTFFGTLSPMVMSTRCSSTWKPPPRLASPDQSSPSFLTFFNFPSASLY